MTRRFSRKMRVAAITAAAVIVAAIVTIALSLYTLQTDWFKNKVRARVVAEIERTTGGRVDLGSFQYDWRSLTAEFQNLVVHGNEPASVAPLFRADSVQIRLKIVSIFRRDVDIRSLAIDRPQVHLVVASDGSTNVPSPPVARRSISGTVDALLNLKVRHFDLRNGRIQVDAHAVPLSASGENVLLRLTYDPHAFGYGIQIRSDSVQVDAEHWPKIAARLDARALLARDRFTIAQARLLGAGSQLEVSGTLHHFANPVADFKINSSIQAADLAKFPVFSDVRGGEFAITGVAHYDQASSPEFRGRISGRNVVYRSEASSLRDVNFESSVLVDRQQAKFEDVRFTALGAHVAGEAVLTKNRDFHFDGTLSGLRVRQASLFMAHSLRSGLRLGIDDLGKFPWTGIIGGNLHLNSSLAPHFQDAILRSDLKIAPSGPGIPISGEVESTWYGRGRRFEFSNSHLKTPGTEISFSGEPGGSLQVALDSSNLQEIQAAMPLAFPELRDIQFPKLEKNGTAHFSGTLAGLPTNLQIAGNLVLTHFGFHGHAWDDFHARVAAAPQKLEFSSASLDGTRLHATGSGQIVLERWHANASSPLHLDSQFKEAALTDLLNRYSDLKLPIQGGIASGSLRLDGSAANPHGIARLTINNIDLYNQPLNQVSLALEIAGQQLRVTHGQARSGPALLSFSGIYNHAWGNWRDGDLDVKVDSNGFPVASLRRIRQYGAGINAECEIHAQAAAHVSPDHLVPENANGNAVFRHVTVNNVPFGSVAFTATTQGQLLNASFQGDLRGSRLAGTAQVELTPGNPAHGEVHVDQIQLSTLNAVWQQQPKTLPVDGLLSGGFSFEGPLQEPEKMQGTIRIEQLELKSNVSGVVFHNPNPILLQAANGLATVRAFQLTGKDTDLTITGSLPYLPRRSMDLNVNGSVDLRFIELFDKNVQAAGVSLIAASVRGSWSDPQMHGTVELKNGSFSFANLPTGLTALNGTLRFDRDRATIQKLAAKMGGGDLALSGFVTFGGAAPLVYRLEADAENVRLRYGGGISITANSRLGLTGTSDNSVLSGTVLVQRIVLNPNTDVGNLLASTAVPAASPANERDFLTGMQFDIRIDSAPNLQLATALSRDLQADIDLRLRGTPAHPVLLGSISANQGDIRVFGAKYTIDRGDVSFVDPVKIQPVLNLDLETIVRGITVDITISGTLGKLNINYRSDPPLQPRDIIALLTVGRTPQAGSAAAPAQLTNDVTALQSSASTVLGQAIAPSSSNRLSKLFGVTNIRIDPMALQGISTTPQARLTIEQNISRQITVTYVTNLSETSEQIFRLEYAFSPQYSLVALRDDNGEFGIDIQYRKRFK